MKEEATRGQNENVLLMDAAGLCGSSLDEVGQAARQAAIEAVRYAKSFTGNVEFSAEDGSRSDRDFLCEIFGAAISAGATTINLPDTVGYAMPDEYGELISYVRQHTPNIGKAVMSVHCHNDLACNGKYHRRAQGRGAAGRGHHQRDW